VFAMEIMNRDYCLPSDLVKAMKLLVLTGLNTVLSGNGSIRISKYEFLITPSGLPKHILKERDLVKYNLLDDTYIGIHKPSIEVNIHKCIYSIRENANTVIHAHPLYTILLVDKGLDKWWETELVESKYSIGKTIVVEPYEPGSIELARNICKYVEEDYNTIIVPKHGVFTWSSNVWRAVESIIALEQIAKYYVYGKILENIVKLF